MNEDWNTNLCSSVSNTEISLNKGYNTRVSGIQFTLNHRLRSQFEDS